VPQNGRFSIVILKERVDMDPSSLVASTIPKSSFIRGKGNADSGYSCVEKERAKV
jgi:hypothetical protein